MIALPHAEFVIQQNLRNLGYDGVIVKKSNLEFSGLSFAEINLDTDGFNQIKNLKLSLFWPTYLFRREIDRIEIEQLNLALVERDIRNSIKEFTRIDNFITLPANNIIVKNIQIDVSINQKALRFQGELNLVNKNGKQDLKAHLSGDQYDIAFNSEWTGIIDKVNQILEIDGIFNGIQLKSNSLQINRGTGWLSYHAKEIDNIISAQFDSGSGKILDIPAHNISVVLGQNDQNYYPILLRAQMSGLEDSYLTADYTYHPIVENREFQSTINIADTSGFITHLNAIRLSNIQAPSLENKSLNLSLTYEQEKRFPAGPLPFKLDSNQNFEGTLLLYPDSYEVRGAIEAGDDFVKILKGLFSIPDENINDNIIRLDKNMKSLLQ